MNYTQVLEDTCYDGEPKVLDKICQVAELVIGGEKHVVFNKENVIGRGESSDIVIDSPTVSMRHAVIEVEDYESHVVYDLSSTNKTKLGKMTLKPHIRYHVRDNETLMFGGVVATYKYVTEVLNNVQTEKCIDQSSCPVIIPESPERLDIPSGIVPETPSKDPFVADSVIETSTDLFQDNGTPQKSQDLYEAETETFQVISKNESVSVLNDNNDMNDIYEATTQTLEGESILNCNNQSKPDLSVENNIQHSPTNQLKMDRASSNFIPECNAEVKNNTKMHNNFENDHEKGKNVEYNIVEELPKSPSVSGINVVINNAGKELTSRYNELNMSEMLTQPLQLQKTVNSKYTEKSCNNYNNDLEDNFEDMLTQSFHVIMKTHNSNEVSNKNQPLLEKNSSAVTNIIKEDNCEKSRLSVNNLNLSEMLTQSFVDSSKSDISTVNLTQRQTTVKSFPSLGDSNFANNKDFSISEMLTQPFDDGEIKNTDEKIKKYPTSDLNISEMLTQTFSETKNVNNDIGYLQRINFNAVTGKKLLYTEHKSEKNIQDFVDTSRLQNKKNTHSIDEINTAKECIDSLDTSITDMFTQPVVNKCKTTEQLDDSLSASFTDVVTQPVVSSSCQRGSEVGGDNKIYHEDDFVKTRLLNTDEKNVDELKSAEELNESLNASIADMFTQPLLPSSSQNRIKDEGKKKIHHEDVDISDALTQVMARPQINPSGIDAVKGKYEYCINSQQAELKSSNISTVCIKDEDLNMSEMYTQQFSKTVEKNSSLNDYHVKNTDVSANVQTNGISVDGITQSCNTETIFSVKLAQNDITSDSSKNNLEVKGTENFENLKSNYENTVDDLNLNDIYDMDTQPIDTDNISPTSNSGKNKSETLIVLSESCSGIDRNMENSKHTNSSDCSPNTSICNSVLEEKKHEKSFTLMKRYSDYFTVETNEKVTPSTFNQSGDCKATVSFGSKNTVNSPNLRKNSQVSELSEGKRRLSYDDEEFSEVLKKKTKLNAKKISSDSDSEDSQKLIHSTDQPCGILVQDLVPKPEETQKKLLSDDEDYSEVVKKKSNFRPRKLSSDSDHDSDKEACNRLMTETNESKRKLSCDEEYSEVLKKKSRHNTRKFSSDSEDSDSQKSKFLRKVSSDIPKTKNETLRKLSFGNKKRLLSDSELTDILKSKVCLRSQKNPSSLNMSVDNQVHTNLCLDNNLSVKHSDEKKQDEILKKSTAKNSSSNVKQTTGDSHSLSEVNGNHNTNKEIADSHLSFKVTMNVAEKTMNEYDNENEKLIETSEIAPFRPKEDKTQIYTEFLNSDLTPMVTSTPTNKSFKNFKKVSLCNSVDVLKTVETLGNVTSINDEISTEQKTSDDCFKDVHNDKSHNKHNKAKPVISTNDISAGTPRNFNKGNFSMIEKKSELSSPETFLGFPETTMEAMQVTDKSCRHKTNVKEKLNETTMNNKKQIIKKGKTLVKKTFSDKETAENKMSESEVEIEIMKPCRPKRQVKNSSLNVTPIDSNNEFDKPIILISENTTKDSSEVLGRGKRKRTRRCLTDYDYEHIKIDSDVTNKDSKKEDSCIRTRKNKNAPGHNAGISFNLGGRRNSDCKINVEPTVNNTCNKDLVIKETSQPNENYGMKLKGELKSHHSSTSVNYELYNSLIEERTKICPWLEDYVTKVDGNDSSDIKSKMKKTYKNKKLSLSDTTSSALDIKKSASTDAKNDAEDSKDCNGIVSEQLSEKGSISDNYNKAKVTIKAIDGTQISSEYLSEEEKTDLSKYEKGQDSKDNVKVSKTGRSKKLNLSAKTKLTSEVDGKTIGAQNNMDYSKNYNVDASEKVSGKESTIDRNFNSDIKRPVGISKISLSSKSNLVEEEKIDRGEYEKGPHLENNVKTKKVVKSKTLDLSNETKTISKRKGKDMENSKDYNNGGSVKFSETECMADGLCSSNNKQLKNNKRKLSSKKSHVEDNPNKRNYVESKDSHDNNECTVLTNSTSRVLTESIEIKIENEETYFEEESTVTKENRISRRKTNKKSKAGNDSTSFNNQSDKNNARTSRNNDDSELIKSSVDSSFTSSKGESSKMSSNEKEISESYCSNDLLTEVENKASSEVLVATPTRRKNSRKTKLEEDKKIEDDLNNSLKEKSRDSSAESLNTSRSGRTLKKPSLNKTFNQNVMFTGYSDQKMMNLVKRLGGDVVDCPSVCTVLVTDKVRRTIKFLCSLTKGCPIVSPQWLIACRKAGCFVDPYLHLLSDPEAEQKFCFNLKHSLDKVKSGPPLLEGWTVHVTPSVKPPPEEMKSVVEFSGGSFLKKIPAKWPLNSVIISCLDDKTKWNTLKKNGTIPPIVNAEAILTGVLHQAFDVKVYKIT